MVLRDISRREFVKRAGATTAGFALADLLVSCDSSLGATGSVAAVAASGVDLAIGSGGWAGRFEPIDPFKPPPLASLLSDRFGRRPGVLIAWRNSSQIENVEVLVRNLGNVRGTGSLRVDILDARTGKLMATRPGVGQELRVEVPPADEGGRDGKIYTLIASRKVNNLLDQFDREVRPYLIRAHVTADGVDTNPTNNTATKSYYTATRAMPAAEHRREFYFTNASTSTATVRIQVQTTKIPAGWKFSMRPREGTIVHLQPGEGIQGLLTVDTAPEVHEAEHVDALVSGVDVTSREALFQDEWFVAVDSQPPKIDKASILWEPDTNMVLAQATVEDLNSGVMEASGVKLEFTTAQEAFTVTAKTLAYVDGNFMKPTNFVGRVGPFDAGSRVLARIGALDTVGNAGYSKVFTINVPAGAHAITVPAPEVSPFLDIGGNVYVPTFP